MPLAQVGAGGEREAAPGRYHVSFGVQETARHGMGYATHTFSAV